MSIRARTCAWLSRRSICNAGRRGVLLGALALPLPSSGCTATAGVEADVTYDYPVVEVATVPVTIESYPRTYYRGSDAYLVDGRWYQRSPGGRWVVYREEPPELRRYRTDYYGRRAAPPAPRPATPTYSYPPSQRP
jgi:hypothetical protein